LYLKVVSYEVPWAGLPTSVYHIFLSNFGRYVVRITRSASTDGFHHLSPKVNILATKNYQHLEDSEVKAQI
jgi:hypothetical protein